MSREDWSHYDDAKRALKEAKQKRRDEAGVRLPEIEAIARRVRVNDLDHIHITVWVTDKQRVEWWPGTGKWQWRIGFKGTQRRKGGFDQFKAWLETEVATAPKNDDDDDMEPWEKYRNDLRYDANGDGVVDENDFPDWRSAGK